MINDPKVPLMLIGNQSDSDVMVSHLMQRIRRKARPRFAIHLFVEDPSPFSDKDPSLMFQPLVITVLCPSLPRRQHQPYISSSLGLRASAIHYILIQLDWEVSRSMSGLLYVPHKNRPLSSVMDVMACVIGSLPEWSCSVGLQVEVPSANLFQLDLTQKLDLFRAQFTREQHDHELRAISQGVMLNKETVTFKNRDAILLEKQRKQLALKEEMSKLQKKRKVSKPRKYEDPEGQSSQPEGDQPDDKLMSAISEAIKAPPRFAFSQSSQSRQSR